MSYFTRFTLVWRACNRSNSLSQALSRSQRLLLVANVTRCHASWDVARAWQSFFFLCKRRARDEIEGKERAVRKSTSPIKHYSQRRYGFKKAKRNFTQGLGLCKTVQSKDGEHPSGNEPPLVKRKNCE